MEGSGFQNNSGSRQNQGSPKVTDPVDPDPEPEFVNLLRRPGIDLKPGGLVQHPYLAYRPARLHMLTESIPGLLKSLLDHRLEWIYIFVPKKPIHLQPTARFLDFQRPKLIF